MEPKTFLDDRSARRRARRKPRLTEDTLAMQDRYRQEGHFSVAEIAFLMASDEYENLQLTLEQYGIHSEEYDAAFSRANTATKTALPYFAMSLKAEMITVREDTITSTEVDDNIRKLLKR